MNNKTGICLAIAMFVIVTANKSLSAQRIVSLDSLEQPVRCEENINYIATALAGGLTSDDLYVIVVARLGDGERSRKLNVFRLESIKWHLKSLRVRNAVTAEGERKKGYGQLEFYIAGKLLLILPIRRKEKLDLLSCQTT